jgi:hypothetical protein
MSRNRAWDLAYVILLAFVFLASLALTMVSVRRNRPLIRSDGRWYYIWARSILLDYDIDFSNDYCVVRDPAEPLPPESEVQTPAGRVVDKYPVGMAILEVPGLTIGHLVARYVVHASSDGVSMPYQIAVSWSLVIFYFVSFLFLYRAMLSLGVSRMWTFGFCMTALVGTNLIHYVAKETTMVHAAGAAVFNILLFLIIRWVGANERVRVVYGLMLGGLLGLLFLIRNTNVLLVPILAAVVWTRRRIRFSELMPMLGGAAVVASLQPVSLWFLWGRFRISTYFNESFTSGFSGIVSTLVSARHGLLVYHPWYAILLLLLAYGVVRMPRVRWICAAALASFLLMTVANGTWWCWWFGHSFGNRAFIEILPSLSIASALVVTDLHPRRGTAVALATLMAAIVLVNLYLWAGYLLQGYPHDGSHTVGQAYGWSLSHSPASLIQRLAH